MAEDHQNSDGGWGESCNSYDDSDLNGFGVSTASQTAWAMLGLMASGEYSSKSVERGADYLIRTQNAHGEWDEEEYTGTGFLKFFTLGIMDIRNISLSGPWLFTDETVAD